jgi:hypothetical protein
VGCSIRDWWSLRAWERQGRQGEIPHPIKRTAVLEYARRHSVRVLIETGTFRGEMLFACRHHFDALYSVELDPELASTAQAHFARWKHIHVLQGDSALKLHEILKELKHRALFWLDAHYCGPAGGRAKKDTPIIDELRLILAHPIPNHVILVDDARCFGSVGDYPSVEECTRFILDRRPDYRAEVRDGIFRFEPPILQKAWQ